MRLIFMGTPDFAAAALAALLQAGHQVVCVYTQPPRPAKRGQQVQVSAVHKLAQAHGLAVRTPARLRDAEEQAAFAALNADVAVVAAYGIILPQAILDAPRHGCINIHASLLPRWRGAAPIQRALLAGDTQTGVCIMQMDAGLDTGPVLLREAIPIAVEETAGSLHDKLQSLGARLIVEALAQLPSLHAQPQPDDGITYAAKIEKAEARLDFSESAELLERKVRAFNPVPGAFAEVHGERLKILAAQVENASGDDDPYRCGDGKALRPLMVQPAGGRPMAYADYLRGRRA